MTAVLVALNIIAGLFLVAVVLLQAGKGADMGAAFGGANPAAFGPATQGNALQKVTAVTAVVFMGSSLALAVVSARQESIFDNTTEPAPLSAPVALPGGTQPTDAAALGDGPASPEAEAGEPAAANAAPAEAAAEGVAGAAREAATGTASPSAETPTSSEPPAAAPQEAAPAEAQ